MTNIFVITTQRPGDDKPVDWYFDDPVEWNQVRQMLRRLDVRFYDNEDYICDSSEFRRWWYREGE